MQKLVRWIAGISIVVAILGPIIPQIIWSFVHRWLFPALLPLVLLVPANQLLACLALHNFIDHCVFHVVLLVCLLARISLASIASTCRRQ